MTYPITPDDVSLCAGCNTMKHLDGSGYCGRCRTENAELGKTGEQLYRAYPIGSTPADELDKQIIDALNSLDWSQAEFGYLPSDDEFVNVLKPLFEQYAASVAKAELEKLKDHAQMFYFLGDNVTKYDAVQLKAIDDMKAALKDGAKGLE